MRLTFLSLPLVCDDGFNAEIELQRFRQAENSGNDFDYQQQQENEGETQNRIAFPLLDIFRLKHSNHILCIFPRPSASKSPPQCDFLTDNQLVSLMTILADLHRNNLCVWPRRLCDSILVDENEGRIYLVGAGLYQVARIAPFQPANDIEELREWLLRSNRLDEKSYKGSSSLLDLQLHFALQSGQPSNDEDGQTKRNKDLNDQQSDMPSRFIWSYRKEYLRICLRYDLNEILESMLQDAVHPLPSAFELYMNQNVALQNEFEQLMAQSKEFVFDLSNNVVFMATDKDSNGIEDKDYDRILKDGFVGITAEEDHLRIAVVADASPDDAELILNSNQVCDNLKTESLASIARQQAPQDQPSKPTISKKESTDNVLPTGEITQKLTDFLFRSFGGGDPNPKEHPKTDPSVKQLQQQPTETSSSILEVFSQSSKMSTIEFENSSNKNGPRVVKRASDIDQPTKTVKEGTKRGVANDSGNDADNTVDEDVQGLEEYFFNKSSSRFSSVLDREYFAREKLPKLEAHLAKYGSLPSSLRRDVWAEISQVQLGGWSKQVFWHILELTNVKMGDQPHKQQQLLDQLKKDLPRCHSYLTSIKLQQSIERILVAWECFDWKQYELNGLLSNICEEDNDVAAVHGGDINRKNEDEVIIDSDAVSNLKHRLAEEETTMQSIIEDHKIVSTLEDFFGGTNLMRNDTDRESPITDEFDVRDLWTADKSEKNLGESNTEPEHLDATFGISKATSSPLLIDTMSNDNKTTGEDAPWDAVFNSTTAKSLGFSTKKRHLDDVLEEMPSHSLFLAQANALGLNYLQATPPKRRTNDAEDGPQLLNPFAVDDLLNDIEEAVDNEYSRTGKDGTRSTKVENEVQLNPGMGHLLENVNDHAFLPAQCSFGSDKPFENNPFWDPDNDCIDEGAAVLTANIADDKDSKVGIKGMSQVVKIQGKLPASPIVSIQQEADSKSQSRKSTKAYGRSYWQGMDSICAAILVACEMDEVAALSVLNYLTEVTFKGKVFAQDTQGIEELGTEVKSRLSFFHPRLSNHLTKLCMEEGESLTVLLLPWLLTCFCHVLPLSLEHDNILLMLLDWVIVGRISVTELVSAVLIQLSNDLLACTELSDVKHCFNRLSFNLHVDMSRLFRQSLKACEAMQTFTAGRDTIGFNGLDNIPLCTMDLGLLGKSSLASQCLLIDLTSNTILASKLERLSLQSELLKGMDLQRDGKIIVDSISRERDAKSKRILVVRANKKEGEEHLLLGAQLARALIQNEVPYVCVLTL